MQFASSLLLTLASFLFVAIQASCPFGHGRQQSDGYGSRGRGRGMQSHRGHAHVPGHHGHGHDNHGAPYGSRPECHEDHDHLEHHCGGSFKQKRHIIPSPEEHTILAAVRWPTELAVQSRLQIDWDRGTSPAVIVDQVSPSGNFVLTVPKGVQSATLTLLDTTLPSLHIDDWMRWEGEKACQNPQQLGDQAMRPVFFMFEGFTYRHTSN